ncbi:glycosyltransferase family 4 protein [Sediminibacterium soli]|uniref:glycosyltransferase family 4 protein n=1 Tax=Sediminibacterium soli TaxID=2698829 RepID=UPI00137A077F|nr:glycosyltransferase family 1 protein [Sediminibacterium soli]NCI48050.1 glycosyltransferase family 4 protein [Sediminibacterium soli]
MKMIVGVDIWDLRVAKTGQKTVTEEYCRQFKKNRGTDIRYVFFDPRWPIYTGKMKWRIMFEHMRYQFWKQVQVPLKAWYHKCDIVFCGDYFAPYIHFGYKTVEIFYDAFFFENPEHCNKLWLKLFHHLAMPAARRCKKIVTITDYSKGRLHELAGFPLEKLVTIYPAPKTFQSDTADIKNSSRFIRPGKRYLLHVGVMEKRKNLPRLIEAFAMLTQKGFEDVDLILVGQGNGKINSDDSANVYQAIADHGLKDRVILTGYLPDEEVAPLYRNAFMYVFPSINEGFGLPILEAFRFGLPVIAANNTCLPEVGGDGMLVFNPFDPADICAKIEAVVSDNALRTELIRKGRDRLHFFSWEKATAQLTDVFREVCKKA